MRVPKGELWWFADDQMHEACNEEEDRIQMIFDLLPYTRGARLNAYLAAAKSA